MGLFDFFKPKNEAGNKKNPIRPNAQNEFELTLPDFATKTHQAKVISSWISPEFYDLLPETEKAGKSTGDKLEIKNYIVDIVLWNNVIELSFNADIAVNQNNFIKKISSQLNWLLLNQDTINDTIIRDLLKLKNKKWLLEDEAPATRESFLKFICPTSIQFFEKAAFNLYYIDGGLFGGHEINVEVSSNAEIISADIVG